MNTNNLPADPVALATAIAGITNDQTRAAAWQQAAAFGAPAIKPLAVLLDDPNSEIPRAANRALWVIARHAGRPGAAAEAKAVVSELVALLGTGSLAVRREVLWMLSELAGNQAIKPMAALLTVPDVREDARLALQRIPGAQATRVLRAALAAAPEDFKPNLAQSLRARGETVIGYPSQKLTPVKQTSVGKPAST